MHVTNPNLFVITGGPGSGKTTVLRELEHRGFRCVQEVARQIIQEQMQSGGKALPWEDTALYTELMLDRSIQSFLEHSAGSGSEIMFADRGIPDILCYARLIGLARQEHIRRACTSYRYASRVVLAPPWKEIYETDSERRQDFAEAVRTYEYMLAVYEECEYDVVELPRFSPPERAEFILEHLRPATKQ